MRGLKSCVVFFLEDLPDVAPHWGAWIEIGLARGYVRCFSVAPHWGAWIEIVYGEGATTPENVAPHWGAWIEICYVVRGHIGIAKSHPTGVRGLKSLR